MFSTPSEWDCLSLAVAGCNGLESLEFFGVCNVDPFIESVVCKPNLMELKMGRIMDVDWRAQGNVAMGFLQSEVKLSVFEGIFGWRNCGIGHEHD